MIARFRCENGDKSKTIAYYNYQSEYGELRASECNGKEILNKNGTIKID